MAARVALMSAVAYAQRSSKVWKKLSGRSAKRLERRRAIYQAAGVVVAPGGTTEMCTASLTASRQGTARGRPRDGSCRTVINRAYRGATRPGPPANRYEAMGA